MTTTHQIGFLQDFTNLFPPTMTGIADMLERFEEAVASTSRATNNKFTTKTVWNFSRHKNGINSTGVANPGSSFSNKFEYFAQTMCKVSKFTSNKLQEISVKQLCEF